MSLIADSLKKANKDTQASGAQGREINPVSGTSRPSRIGVSFWIMLLLVLTGGLLAYLIQSGVFDERRTQWSELPIFLALGLGEKKAPPLSVVAEVPPVKPLPVEKIIPPVQDPRKIGPSVKKPPLRKKPGAVVPPLVVLEKPAPPAAKKKAVKPGPPAPPREPKPMRTVSPAEPMVREQPQVAVIPPLAGAAEKPERPAAAVVIKAIEKRSPASVSPEELQAAQQAPSAVPPVREEPKAVVSPLVELKQPVTEKEISLQVPQKAVAVAEAGKPVSAAESVTGREPQVAKLPLTVTRPEAVESDSSLFKTSDYFFNRAIFFQQSKEWKKALENYSKAAELDSDNADIYNNRGVVYKEMGRYDAAIEELLRAVYLKPDYAKAYNNLGVVYYLKKHYSSAVRNYRQAIDLDPENLEAFNNLAIVHKKRNEIEKAKAVLNKALALNPDHPGTNYNLAILHEEIEDYKPAIYYYRRFVDLGRLSHPALVFKVQEHLETLRN